VRQRFHRADFGCVLQDRRHCIDALEISRRIGDDDDGWKSTAGAIEEAVKQLIETVETMRVRGYRVRREEAPTPHDRARDGLVFFTCLVR